MKTPEKKSSDEMENGSRRRDRDRGRGRASQFLPFTVVLFRGFGMIECDAVEENHVSKNTVVTLDNIYGNDEINMSALANLPTVIIFHRACYMHMWYVCIALFHV